jgi:hypothetical protein
MKFDSMRCRWCMGGLLVQLWSFSAGCGGTNEGAALQSPSTMQGAAPARSVASPPTSAGSSAVAPAAAGSSAVAPPPAAVHDAGPPPSASNTFDAGSKPGDHPAPRDASADDQDSSTALTDAAVVQDDAAVAAHVVHVDSKVTWNASGFQVEAGKCYLVQTKIDDKWLDLDVKANLMGWADQSDARLALFAPLRRVVQPDIGFYQFATCVDKALDQCFAIGEASTICPKMSGELFFFVNDAPGFETNNVGTATVTIQAN